MLDHTVDFTAPVATSFVLGGAFSFQFWFRDSLTGVASSDALRITFTP